MTAKSIELYGARLVSAVGHLCRLYRGSRPISRQGGRSHLSGSGAAVPKSSAGLTATFDNNSPISAPGAADRTLLGLISAGSREGQWLEWEFEAAQPGFIN